MNPKLPAEERAADLVEAIDDLLEFLVPNQEQVKIQVLRSSGYGVWIHVTQGDLGRR